LLTFHRRRTEKRYDEDFFDETAEYTFKDHRAPQLSTVVDFCEDAYEYLSRDPENVVIVHCKAGKGRTGVMIASLLVRIGTAKDAAEAIKIYGDQRTLDGRGVTIPSQRRYVYYFSNLLLHPEKTEDKTIIIHSISLSGQQNAVTIDGKGISFSLVVRQLPIEP
jgi:phosphatidylinositol-3,4,5-trisphosphate 3-phosphatase/dual-specificity protein phosphatase PTEN